MNLEGVFRAFASLAWMIFIAAAVFAVYQASRGRKIRSLQIVIAVVGVLALLSTMASLGIVFIDPQERGVVISAITPNGFRTEALGPGLHWIMPGLERVVRYSISKTNYTMSIAPLEGNIQGDDSVTARTSDGQEIFVDASVIFAVNPEQVIQLHITWQDRFKDELVRPQARGVIRDIVSQYGVEEVVTSKRFEMVSRMEEELTKKLAENGLLLEDFVIRNITFSEEYAASVEQKQIAEQQAQQAALVVEQRRQEAEQARQVAQGQADAVVIRAEGEAEARVIEATAEAEALRLIAEAIEENPDLLTYQYITKLAPGIQVMLVPNNAPYLLPLPDINSTILENTEPE